MPPVGFSYREVLDDLPGGLRAAYSPDLGYAVVQSDVARVAAEAAGLLPEIGIGLEALEGGLPEPGGTWGFSGAWEMLAKLHSMLPEHEEEFGRSFITGVKAGSRMTPERWGAMRKLRSEINEWCADVFDRYDILLTPTVPYDAPPARGPFAAETEGPVMVETNKSLGEALAACAGGATYAAWDAAARAAWLERVKFAASPGQVLQCLLLLETRVAQDWVNQWWWLTPRPNAALRVATTAAAGARLYAFDRALKYEMCSRPRREKRHRGKGRKRHRKAPGGGGGVKVKIKIAPKKKRGRKKKKK